MAKRSTIGENPLDVVLGESPLDTLVPDPLAPPQPLPQPYDQETQARRAALEAENQVLSAEINQLKTQESALRDELDQLKAQNQGLGAELAQLKAEDDARRTELTQQQEENGKLSAALEQLRAEITKLKEAESGRLAAAYAPRRRCN